MAKDKKDVIIRVMLAGLIVLFLVLIYILVVNPLIKTNQTNNYNQAYTQGQIDLFNSMVLQINNRGFVNLPLNENQSLILIPYNPSQQTQS